MKKDVYRFTDIIDEVLGPATTDLLLKGQPDGSFPEWQYDTQLVEDIAKACRACAERMKMRMPL